MTVYSATNARANLYKIMEQVTHSHKPVQITGKKTNVVVISGEDWSAIQETLYLLSIPKMGKSIRDGMKTPLKDCDEDLNW